VVPIDLSAKGMNDALFPEHAHGINKGQASIVDLVDRGLRHRLPGFSSLGRLVFYCWRLKVQVPECA
jgi:hypothetical protein